MDRRRVRGEGNIRERSDSRIEARVYLDDGDTRVRRSFYGDSREAVARALRTAQATADRRLPVGACTTSRRLPAPDARRWTRYLGVRLGINSPSSRRMSTTERVH
jgi:hypothetical protein